MEIMIGRGRESDHLLIPVLGRSFPASADPWDASWLRTPVHVRAGGFTADLDARLRLRDDPASGNTLSFEIQGLDQTDLPPLVAALLAVEERFPL
ncbi:hypothetical protein ACBR40_41325 [Nonomuraea sp. AD125B]|uniref:hypothetical protein n=1 Tax=Nonomuraea sp. AD125B TaxID=3242897 RepID=UPI003529CA3B